MRELPRGTQVELKGLKAEVAEIVGQHLIMVGRLIDEDPLAALAHAEAAKSRASRLPITREALGEAAYAAGSFEIALAEFRTLRRLIDAEAFLPAMADCERALGRLDAGLKLIKEGLAANPEPATRIELRLVEAGIRHEMGQTAEAVRLLKTEIIATGKRGSRLARARLRYAYANLIEELGDDETAEKWFVAASLLDENGLTGAADRAAALQGIQIEFAADFEDDEAVSAEDSDDESLDDDVAASDQDDDFDDAAQTWDDIASDDELDEDASDDYSERLSDQGDDFDNEAEDFDDEAEDEPLDESDDWIDADVDEELDLALDDDSPFADEPAQPEGEFQDAKNPDRKDVDVE